MSITSLQSWREPLAGDWRARAKALGEDLRTGAGGDVGGRLRRLAAMRLGDGERLVLRRLVRHVRSLPEPLAGFRSLRVLLVSNRTMSFFAADLEASGAARSLIIEAVETGYDSVRTLALNPTAELPAGRFDAVLLALDADFFAPQQELLDSPREREVIAGVCAQLAAVIAGLRDRLGAPVIAATMAVPPDDALSSSELAMAGTTSRLIHALNAAISESAADGHAVLFDLASVASRIGTTTFFDPGRFHQAKVPFSLEVGPVVADALAALLAAMMGKAGRALVLDLDNTLWGGVVADDGVEQIAVGQGSPEGEAFAAVQRHALELRRRGIVLAVCSKNVEAIAREPFIRHPDMQLRETDFAVFVANFEDKATNIARIAAALDLDPSSLVFLDDNPAERERVRSALPFVMVPEVGDDPALFVRSLVTSGFFEHLPLTRDDALRATAYQARAEAKALAMSIGDYAAYLQSLDMELSITPFDAIGRARIAQLIQKSNQFNLTTKRYSELDVATIEADPTRLGWQMRLKDRFADHGMIGVVIAETRHDTWSIDTWIMSCRVLERGVEHAVMQSLAACAAKAGARRIEGTYRPTPRNGLVKEFYPRLGFTCVDQPADGSVTYRLDLPATTETPIAMRVRLSPA
jgi:FkbH-like protein